MTARERDGSIGVRDPQGRSQALPLDRLEVRTKGPRGAVTWERAADRASRTEQLGLFREAAGPAGPRRRHGCRPGPGRTGCRARRGPQSRILSVEVTARVNPDGSMDVVERLAFDFDGDFNGGTREIPPGDYSIDFEVSEAATPRPRVGLRRPEPR